MAKKPCKLPHRTLPEPRGKRRGWPGRQIANGFQASPAQGRLRFLIQPHGGNRQPPDRLRLVCGRHRLKSCECLRRRWCARDCKPQMDKGRQAALDISDQRCFPIEQMCAAGDIEGKPIGRIEFDQGRVAITAIGQPFEPVSISGMIMRHDLQIGHTGLGIGQRLPRAQSRSGSFGINRNKTHRTALFLDRRQGPSTTLSLRAGVRGQWRQRMCLQQAIG